jgi:putative lipase involved disintegration of autophagic bodies
MMEAWIGLQADTINAFKKLTPIYREMNGFIAYGHRVGGAIATLAARTFRLSFNLDYYRLATRTENPG